MVDTSDHYRQGCEIPYFILSDLFGGRGQILKFLTTKITKLQNFYLLLSLIHHGADTFDF